MPNAVRTCAFALMVGMVAAIAPAAAQFPAAPDDQQPLAGTPKAKKKAAPPASATSINGSWAGELTQVGSQSPYKVELTVNARGAETKYPDLDCTGKLTRAGSSRAYTFFIEAITKGQVDKGGRCPDGTITMARQGEDLALGWFGSVDGHTIVAFGTLKKK
jgi:hypothetical protein